MHLTEDMLSTLEQRVREWSVEKLGSESTAPLLFAQRPFQRISVYDELERILKTTLPPPNELEEPHALAALLDICNASSHPLHAKQGTLHSVPQILDHMIGMRKNISSISQYNLLTSNVWCPLLCFPHLCSSMLSFFRYMD